MLAYNNARKPHFQLNAISIINNKYPCKTTTVNHRFYFNTESMYLENMHKMRLIDHIVLNI